MPHAGLMSTKESFDNAEGALLRARLHIRGARRRLSQGKISAGIVTLYDALIFALRFYFMTPEHSAILAAKGPLDLTEERDMLMVLREAGILGHTFDLDRFEALVEQAGRGEMPDYDFKPMLSSFESLMNALEVIPFDEALLPAEDPAAF